MIDSKITEEEIVNSKIYRDKAINNVEVLDKVKKLFLIPKLDVMTMRMISDYYEVDIESIKKCYQRNKNEIDTDGTTHKDVSEFIDLWKGHNVPTKNRGHAIFKLADNMVLDVPNAGIKVFSKRAVLRFGMLIRDSAIAKEVRTQLLNVFEHSTEKQKTVEIDEEMKLKSNIGIAYVSGNMDDFAKATMEYNNYRSRYITKIKNENTKLSNLNKDLETTNALLTRKTLEWGNKPILNALIRKYAIKCFNGKYQFSSAWEALYRQVKYKYHIDIKARKGTGAIVNRIKDSEFANVIEVAVGLCEANNINVGKTVNAINADNIKSYQ